MQPWNGLSSLSGAHGDKRPKVRAKILYLKNEANQMLTSGIHGVSDTWSLTVVDPWRTTQTASLQKEIL